MTNNIKKISTALIICIIAISHLMPLTAYAASISVKSSKSTILFDDTVTVDVSFIHDGIGSLGYGSEKKGAVFEYNSSVLKFVSGEGANASGGSGKIVLSASSSNAQSLKTSLTFKAIGVGSSNVSVSANIIDFVSEESVGSVNSSTTITVKPVATPAPTPTPTPTPKPTEAPTAKPTTKPTAKPTSKPTQKPTSTPKASSTPKATTTPKPSSTPKATSTPKPTATSVPTSSVEPTTSPSSTSEVVYTPMDDAIKLDIHGEDLYMWKDISSVELPEGFGLGSISYDGEKVEAMMDIENKLILVYLSDEKGENGDLYYYDSTSGLVFPYANVETNLSYIILQPAETIEIPQGYKETTYIIDGKTVKAWALESGEAIGFYLVYAMDSKGNRGFYTYDSSEGTLQRFTERTLTIEAQATEEPDVVEAISDEIEEEPKQGISQRYGQIIKIGIIVLSVIALSLIAILVHDSRRRRTSKHSRR